MKLQLVDLFAKTAEEASVRTSSGGIVSLGACALLVWLLVLQVRDYMHVEWHQMLVVDKSRGGKMTIKVDITFPNLPCELLSIDAMDDMGDIQQDLDSQLVKLDLDAAGNPLDADVKQRQREQKDRAIAARGPDYEGPCFGAEAGLPAGQTKCVTCDDVRRAYAAMNWQFHDGHGFEQCVAEGFPSHVQENKDNGCRVTGSVDVSKVVGKLHFAPGESFFRGGKHSHDLSTYFIPDLPYDFSHNIREFSFGEQYKLDTDVYDPLKDREAVAPEKQFQYRYFMKVVGSILNYMNGTSVSTNGYSVTYHERPLTGGRDTDHPHSLHQVGGIPGIWFNYDISPMMVLEVEGRYETLGEVIMNIFAMIGAVITTGALIDRGVYVVDKALKARKDR